MRSQELKNYFPFGIVIGSLFLLFIFLGPLKPLDDGITAAIDSWPRALHPIMETISYLASTPVMIGFVIAWCVMNLLYKRRDRALILVSSLINVPIFVLLKHLVQRARPEGSPMIELGFNGDSFPSGHSASSMAVYLTIAYLLYRHFKQPWSKILLWFAALMVVLVGISRIYLHAHHPTDVLAGWLVGGIGLLVVREVANKLEGKEGSSSTK